MRWLTWNLSRYWLCLILRLSVEQLFSVHVDHSFYSCFTDVQAECGTNFTAAINNYCDYLPLDQCVSGFPGVSTTQAPTTTTTQRLLTVPTTLGPRESKFIYHTPKITPKDVSLIISLKIISSKNSPLNDNQKNRLWRFPFHSTNFKIKT